MELDKNKTKQLLEKAKVFTGEMIQKHEQSSTKNKIKRLLDTTNPSKNYAV